MSLSALNDESSRVRTKKKEFLRRGFQQPGAGRRYAGASWEYNILVRNRLQAQLFAQGVNLLLQKGLPPKKGTISDSTIIAAPSSTKNPEKQRDPDAHQVKKGNAYPLGYKAHVGVDKDSGLGHTVEATGANIHDVTMTPKPLTGEKPWSMGTAAISEPPNTRMPPQRTSSADIFAASSIVAHRK